MTSPAVAPHPPSPPLARTSPVGVHASGGTRWSSGWCEREEEEGYRAASVSRTNLKQWKINMQKKRISEKYIVDRGEARGIRPIRYLNIGPCFTNWIEKEEVHLTSLNSLGSLSFHPDPKKQIFFAPSSFQTDYFCSLSGFTSGFSWRGTTSAALAGATSARREVIRTMLIVQGVK